MLRWLSPILLVALTACSNPESAQLADHDTCLELGFEAWSRDYSYCRLTLHQGRTGAAKLVLLPPKKARPATPNADKPAPETTAAAPAEEEVPAGSTKEPPPPTPVPRQKVKPDQI